jgi:hypothetical protein
MVLCFLADNTGDYFYQVDILLLHQPLYSECKVIRTANLDGGTRIDKENILE